MQEAGEVAVGFEAGMERGEVEAAPRTALRSLRGQRWSDPIEAQVDRRIEPMQAARSSLYMY